MILLNTTAAQTLTTGQSATFSVLRQTGCSRANQSEFFNSGSGSVFLRGGGLYEIGYHANVTGATAAAPVELSIQFAGSTLPETTSVYTPATASAVGSVSATTYVGTTFPSSGFTVTLTNTGVNPIDISANALLYIRRVG